MDYLDSEFIDCSDDSSFEDTIYPINITKLYTIYCATNIINNKKYIGFDSNWPNRRTSHNSVSFIKHSVEYNYAFHRAIRKYGKDVFKWEILYTSYDYHHTHKIVERYLIIKYKTWNQSKPCLGYNTTLGGDGTLGNKHTKKSIEKRARILSNRYKNKELIPANYNKNVIRHDKRIPKIKDRNLKYIYEILCPDNSIKITNNLRQFCRDYNLDRRHLHATIKNDFIHSLGYKIIKQNLL